MKYNVKQFVISNLIMSDIRTVDILNKNRNFLSFLNSMGNDESFYDFCIQNKYLENRFCTMDIKKKIIRNDVLFKEDELDDNDYIYNWFLKDKLRYYLKHDFQFFIEIAKEINLIG